MSRTIAYLSGSKGGTGKTTLSMLTSILLRSKGKKVLVVDLGESGNITTLIAGSVEPPFFVDYLQDNETYWGDVIVETKYGIYLAPAPPRLESKYILEIFSKAKNVGKKFGNFVNVALEHVDYIIIDFPAFPTLHYSDFIDSGTIDISCLIINPDPLSFSAAKKAYTGKSFVIPILNKYHPVSKFWLDAVREYFGNAYVVPFDASLSFLMKETTDWVVRNIDKKTKKAVEKIIEKFDNILIKEVTL